MKTAGLTRYEAFEDCGSIDDTEMLALAARRKLAGPSRSDDGGRGGRRAYAGMNGTMTWGMW